MEIITGVERRRRWRPVQKLRILAELEEPGATVTAVARRHEVSRGLIWQWRGALRRGDLVVQEPAFLPMRVAVASGRCGNKGGVRRGPLEGRFLDSLAGEQTSPDLVALFIEELTAEWNRLTGDRSEALTAKRRYLAKVERKVAGLIDAIADGLRTQGPRERLEALEARRAVLAREVADHASQGSTPRPGRSVPHAGGASSRPTADERPAGGQGGAAGTDSACKDTPS